MRPLRTIVFLSLLVGMTAPPARGQERRIAFSEPGWTLQGEHTRIDTVDRREVLRIRTGAARFPGVSLEDGTIEFDMAVTPYRSFVYLLFRMQSDGDYEELYFRPHKSGLPDAVQYSPVYAGVSNWQLYHGEGFTGNPRLEPDQWLHVRVVIQGTRAAVFVGEAGAPQLLVRHLARDAAPGFIGLRSFFIDPSAPEDLPGVTCANLVVRPGVVDFDFSAVEDAPAAPAGTVMRWSVSPAFAAPDSPIEQLPPAASWTTLEADRRGVVVFGRHFPRPPDVERPAVLASVRILADRARTVPVQLGFSDDATVFLNGRPLFYRDESYRFDEPRREGLIGLDQATVYLPLRQGANELTLAISDVFGGWAVMGRITSAAGVTVEPR